jgi:hypothetical protein
MKQSFHRTGFGIDMCRQGRGMPRIEADLDNLLAAIEINAECGHWIGTMVDEGQLTKEEALTRLPMSMALSTAWSIGSANPALSSSCSKTSSCFATRSATPTAWVNSRNSPRRRLARLAARPSTSSAGSGANP